MDYQLLDEVVFGILDDDLSEILMKFIETLSYEEIGQLVVALIYYIKDGKMNYKMFRKEIIPCFDLLRYIVDLKRREYRKLTQGAEKKQ